MSRVLATADIGSNTAHLLVARIEGNRIQRLANESEWLNLGEVVSRQGQIPNDLADRLVATLGEFQARSMGHKAKNIYVFATEAMRRASNHDAIIRRVESSLGISIEIITPEQEAELSIRGVQIDSEGPTPAALLEIGGGSAQVAIFDGTKIMETLSLPLGTGRLIAESGLTYPSTTEQVQKILDWVELHTKACQELPKAMRIIGSGGVARGLWRGVHPDGDRELHLNELDYVAWTAARLTTDQVSARFGVRQKRALTFVPGAIAYASLIRALGHESFCVSEFGVREGALTMMYERASAKVIRE